MSRAGILALLAAFVVGVGVLAWLGPGNGVHSLTTPPPATPTPRPHVPCEVVLTGDVKDCGIPVSDPTTRSACVAAGNVLRATMRLRGNARDYVLSIAMVGWYHGASTYQLWPWGQTSLTAPDVPKVALQFDSGAIWESSDGSMTVAAGGQSGTLDARLGYVSGLPEAPLGLLTLSGSWSCV
ncbi:MAG: hypothetical protein JOZ46_03815 [Candidatus Dormibacteraeota bacterium]|nr:hypothetical protein [Candidatus Dormibacteraeota bacterium]